MGAIEGHPCGQFSYPTIQLAPDGGRVLVAYTVLFLPGAMPTACRVRLQLCFSLFAFLRRLLRFTLTSKIPFPCRACPEIHCFALSDRIPHDWSSECPSSPVPVPFLKPPTQRTTCL